MKTPRISRSQKAANKNPVLYVMAGLPGVGKSTLAKTLATHTQAVYLRIDTIEQALRDFCQLQVEGQGYRMAYRIAADNLRLGRNVVADSCNPVLLTRNEWEQVALSTNAFVQHIEVVCTDHQEHRHRIETRASEIPGLRLPNWEAVVQREYHAWDREHVCIDTAGKTASMSWDACRDLLGL